MESHPVYDQTQGTGAVFSSLYGYLYYYSLADSTLSLNIFEIFNYSQICEASAVVKVHILRLFMITNMLE